MADKKPGVKTIEPVKKQALGSVTPPAVTAQPDPIESWMETHPSDTTFTADASAAQATDTGVPPTTATGVEPQSTPPSGDTAQPAASVTSPPETPSTQAPAVEPKASAPPTETPATPAAEVKPAAEPAKPAIAEPLRVTAEGKYVLAEGAEPWTGEQIVMALRERTQALPRAKVAEQFEALFGMPVDKAEQEWKPVLQALWDHRERQGLINDLLFNCTAEKFDYFVRCNSQYDTEVPPTQPQAHQPAQPAVPPEVKKQLDELSSWRAQREKQDAVDRVNREMAQAIAKYPFLASDIGLRDELLLTARVLNSQDPNKGIADALASKASIYDSILVARSAQSGQPKPTAVPALNGSPGASPTGTRPTQTTKPKAFDSLDDGVEDWLTNDSKNYSQ